VANKKVYGFNEEGFGRVVEATRIVLRTPVADSRRRRQPPVLSGASGSGGKVVVFSIDSYDDASGIAVCAIEYRPYGDSTVNGESQYGTIDVIDPAGCFFNEDEADLIGRWGTAAYMTPTAANARIDCFVATPALNAVIMRSSSSRR